MSKTIVRWTVGNVSEQGIQCLKLSVKNVINLYGRDGFRYFVCHNGISKAKLGDIAGVELLDQERFSDSLPIPPSGVSWKLYPPRLDMDAREVFIDNDLVLYKKMDFERMPNGCFMSEAIMKSYGSFESRIESPVNMNSGFFGIPPGFDFGSELSMTIREFEVDWLDSYFEEQGAVAYVLHKKPHWVAMMDEIAIFGLHDDFKILKFGSCATHFIGLNNGQTSHWRCWRGKYKTIL